MCEKWSRGKLINVNKNTKCDGAKTIAPRAVCHPLQPRPHGRVLSSTHGISDTDENGSPIALALGLWHPPSLTLWLAWQVQITLEEKKDSSRTLTVFPFLLSVLSDLQEILK